MNTPPPSPPPMNVPLQKKKIHLQPRPKILNETFAKALNEEQKAVVVHEKGPALVIAGAGSGKTRALTYRVAYLLDNGEPAESIVLVTFTKKAAEEMIHRVEKIAGNKAKGIHAGTFHHLANDFLRKYATTIGFKPNFSILDENDRESVMKMVYGQLVPKDLKTRYPSPDVLIEILSKSLNVSQPVKQILSSIYPQFISIEAEIKTILTKFEQVKHDRNVMDFDDMMIYFRQFLQDETASKAFRTTIRHVLVDEYQDVNAIQADIVHGLGKDAKSLVVVGDDAQAIYGFRGSDFTHMLNYPTIYPGCAQYKLEENYRSTPEILTLANTSILKNVHQFSKNLHTTRPTGERPTVVPCANQDYEARFVCQSILNYRDQNIPLCEQAILFRNQHHKIYIERELIRSNIPYEVRAGLRFFEQAHMKDLAAFMIVMVNPADMVQWTRLLTIHDGISTISAEKVLTLMEKSSNPLADFILMDFPSKLAGKKIQKTGLENLHKLQELFKGMVWDTSHNIILPSDQYPSIPSIFSTLTRYLEPYIKKRYENAEDRLQDFQEIQGLAAEYHDLGQFLGDMVVSFTLVGQTRKEGDPTREEKPVVLSTIHQAKGLEWTAVFLIGAADGNLPGSRSIGNADAIEEERRLFYVACTRAKDYLWISYPQYSYLQNSQVLNQPSRFLTEIEKDGVYELGELDED